MNQPPPYAFPNKPGYPYGQPQRQQAKPVSLIWYGVIAVLAIIVYVLFYSLFSPHWVEDYRLDGSNQRSDATRPLDTMVFSHTWRLQWTCDVQGNPGGTYKLQVINVDTGDVLVSTVCGGDKDTSDTTPEQRSGVVNLHVIADGAWFLDVQELR